MNTELFDQSEIVRRYDDEWKETSEWRRLNHSDEFRDRLVRRVQEHYAGITILGGNTPLGSGVLVRSTAAYGVLTAGHVCTLVKDEIGRDRPIRCIPQATREPVPAGKRGNLLVRELSLRGVTEVYAPPRETPDYGCLMVPLIDGRAMEAWGTFVNLTKHGRSRKHSEYRLAHNAWVAAGYLQERSTETAAYHWHAIGAPEVVYQRDGQRYLYIRSMESDCGNPKRLNGMSGSGVWEIPIGSRLTDTTVEIGTPILRGVTFLQEIQSEDGNLAFYAHELEPIADDVVAKLDEGQ